MIDGVVLKPLKQFGDARGKVMHMMRKTDEHFDNFGEVYFSVANEDVVKAWMYHKKNTSNYVVVNGKAKIVLHDKREDSKTKGETNEFVLAEHPDSYFLLKIPAGVVHGFKAIEGKAMIANLTTEPFNAEDNFKISPESGEIPYSW